MALTVWSGLPEEDGPHRDHHDRCSHGSGYVLGSCIVCDQGPATLQDPCEFPDARLAGQVHRTRNPVADPLAESCLARNPKEQNPDVKALVQGLSQPHEFFFAPALLLLACRYLQADQEVPVQVHTAFCQHRLCPADVFGRQEHLKFARSPLTQRPQPDVDEMERVRPSIRHHGNKVCGPRIDGLEGSVLAQPHPPARVMGDQRTEGGGGLGWGQVEDEVIRLFPVHRPYKLFQATVALDEVLLFRDGPDQGMYGKR